VPILCVDLVPVRRPGDPGVEVGLIRRAMPGGRSSVWCHLGGRVRRNETLRAALLRPLHETLEGVQVDLPLDPQPRHVVQWFPASGPLETGPALGSDPRQHAVALVFPVTLVGTPVARPGSEASDFRWWPREQLDGRTNLRPGALTTIDGVLHAG
jgi:ADP-ribose pyrophosphatase YjhB (NUDIX family)